MASADFADPCHHRFCRGGLTTYSVPQRGSTRIANDIRDSIVHPSLDGITVMKTSDCWGNQSIGRELASREAGLAQPGLVERDFIVHVRVCCVVQCLMGKSVRKMSKSVPIGRNHKPRSQSILRCTYLGPNVALWSGRPQVSTGTKRLLELERSVRWAFIVDHTGRLAKPIINLDSPLDVTVAIVGHLQEKRRTCRESTIQVGLPRNVRVQV